MPVVKAGAHVFTFQNGVESAERLDSILGAGTTVPGVAYISATLGAPGHIVHRGQSPHLLFGERDGALSARVQAFAEDLSGGRRPGVGRHRHHTRPLAKIRGLAPAAAMTALTRATLGQLRTEPRARRLLQSLVDEAVAVGMAEEVGVVDPADVDRVMKGIDSLPENFRSSMAFDIDNGKPLELPWLSGAIVRIGEQMGVPTPSHRFCYDALAVWEKGKAR